MPTKLLIKFVPEIKFKMKINQVRPMFEAEEASSSSKMRINQVRPMFEAEDDSYTLWDKLFRSSIKFTIQEADEKSKKASLERENKLMDILYYQTCSVSYWNFLWLFAGPVLGMTLVLIGFVYWPNENLFVHPHRWWDCILQCSIVYMGEIFSLTEPRPNAFQDLY